MNIEKQRLLEESLKNGVNLFVGAGFSVLTTDKHNRKLPLANELCEELKSHFNKKGPFNLSQLSSILESAKKEEFRKYLIDRFSVSNFDEDYFAILNINIKGIYTTNIDNLLHKIYQNSTEKYLHDISINGSNPNDPSSIDFSALHGSIMHPDKPFIFDTVSLSNTYANSPRVWNYLSNSIERYPTIFLGYGINDTSVIQALTSQSTSSNSQKDRWIMIREEDLEMSEFYSSLGFNIIVSNTKEFLTFLKNQKNKTEYTRSNFTDIEYIFSKSLVPKNAFGQKVRPINEFFLGSAPIWSDIFSNQIVTTSHFKAIQDKLFDNQNIIVIGTPVSGKSTLLMQLAVNTEFSGIKLIFNNIELSKAQLLCRILDDRKAMILIDNFCDSIEAFSFLGQRKNLKIIGFDRGHNHGIVSHLLNEDSFYVHNVTQLTELDIQKIYNSLPTTIRRKVIQRQTNIDYDKDSIFEFISRNVISPSLSQRFKSVMKDLEEENPLLAEFLLLSSYVHSTRVPLSFEMAYSYFSQDIDHYEKIYDMRDKLGDLLKEYSGDLMLNDDQDYYYPRSINVADTILSQSNTLLLKKVISKALENIPTVQICSYNVYRKKAYDKNIIGRTFQNWEEGKEFYEKVYQNDFKNPYILQQGALYLASRKRFTDAFHWIDRALTQTDNKYFSIRNSHAIILFDANINAKNENADIRGELDKSMSILEKCINADKRKNFHAIRYAEQALAYSERYYDAKSSKYLENAKAWLKEDLKKYPWNHDAKRALRLIEERLN